MLLTKMQCLLILTSGSMLHNLYKGKSAMLLVLHSLCCHRNYSKSLFPLWTLASSVPQGTITKCVFKNFVLSDTTATIREPDAKVNMKKLTDYKIDP